MQLNHFQNIVEHGIESKNIVWVNKKNRMQVVELIVFLCSQPFHNFKILLTRRIKEKLEMYLMK